MESLEVLKATFGISIEITLIYGSFGLLILNFLKENLGLTGKKAIFSALLIFQIGMNIMAYPGQIQPVIIGTLASFFLSAGTWSTIKNIIEKGKST